MRIAFIPGLFPMLSETPVLNQITGLVKRGHAVDIFGDRPRSPGAYHPSIDRYQLLERARWTRPSPPSQIQRWIDVTRMVREASGPSRRILLRTLHPRWGPRGLTGRLAHEASAFLPPGEYDIIHGGFGQEGRRALRMKRLGALKGRLVTAIQGADLSKFVQTRGPDVYQDLFRVCDLFLPVSSFFGRRLTEMGCPPEKIVVMRTGIDLELFAYRPRVPAETLRLVSVGRLVEKKGLEDALKAMAMLAGSGVPVEYDIVGDGPLRPRLEALVRDLGLGERVRFMGSQGQETLPAILAAAQVMLVPSVTAPTGDQEGIPNVIKEGMALGLLVVSTRHAGIPELVEDGVTGYLADERDPAGLARSVSLLKDSSDRWPAIQDAARRRVEEEYEIERLNDRLVEIYEGLLLQKA